MKKILVRLPNYLGDLILTTPVLRALKLEYPNTHLTVLCKESLGGILEENPFVDDLIEFQKGGGFSLHPKDSRGSKLIPRLRKMNFDLAITLSHTFSSCYMLLAAGIRERVSFGFTHNLPLLTKRAEGVSIHKGPMRSYQQFLSVLKPLGIDRPSTPKLYIKPRNRSKLTLGVNMSAARSSKVWPKKRFRETLSLLTERFNDLQVLCFGDNSMHPLIEEMIQHLPPTVINIAGKTDLPMLISEIASCHAFLTNDSGPMHIAAAYKVPMVALFGSTQPSCLTPYKKAHLIYKKVDCSPCYKNNCPINHPCMQTISVEEVVNRLSKMLEASRLIQK